MGYMKLLELTYTELRKKQDDITYLFPSFKDRVKQVSRNGGTRLIKQKGDVWQFKTKSGTDSGVRYDNWVRFKDLDKQIRKFAKDKKVWLSDGSRIDLIKLATKIMMKGDFELFCSCPAYRFWGPAYILTKNKAKYTEPERRLPKIRNPQQRGAYCKHLQIVMEVLPMYIGTLAKYLGSKYSDVIKKVEDDVRKSK